MTKRPKKPRANAEDPLAESDLKALSDPCGAKDDDVQAILAACCDDEMPDDPPPRCIADDLARLVLRSALPPDIRRRIRLGPPVAVVVQVPGPDWCTPLFNAVMRDGRVFCVSCDGSSRSHKPSIGGADVARRLSRGVSVVGVSQNPSGFLPGVLVSVADAHATVAPPGVKVMRALLRRHARGRSQVIPDGLTHGLTFSEIVAAFRPRATARGVIANLQATSRRKSRASHSDDCPPLQDLPGYSDDAMRWGARIADAVADHKAGRGSWPKDSGALLWGPPGTGKTLYARALAKGAGLTFVPTSVGAWFSGQSKGDLGDVVQAVRRSWDDAVASRPSLWFVDEISSLPDRSRLDADRLSWWAPVVDSVLDILTSPQRDGVVVLAACNADPSSLDPALVRPGRFGTHLLIPAPDAQGLADVLRFHLGDDALPGLDLSGVTQLAPGATPAQAAGWADAVWQAAKDAGRDPTLDDLLAVVAPPDDRPPDLLRRVAIHEAGHALAFAAAGTPLASLSLIRQGVLGGATRLDAARPATHGRRVDLDAEVVAVLAGRAAEQVLIGDVTAGAEADLAMATRGLAAAHGAQGLGSSLIHHADPWGSIAYDRALRDAVDADLRRLYAQALALIRRRRGAVERIADALLARRFLTGDDVARLLSSPGSRARAPKDRGRNP